VRLSPWVLLFLVSLVFSFLFDSTSAQACAMCKTAVVSQDAGAMQALNIGILVLLLPPIGILTTILVLTFRHDE
jgi:hypothetical protein